MTLPDSDKLAALLAEYDPDDFTDLDFMVADLARAVLDLRAEVARLTAERDACLDAVYLQSKAIAAAHRAGLLAAAEIVEKRVADLKDFLSLARSYNGPPLQSELDAELQLGEARQFAAAIRAAAEGAP